RIGPDISCSEYAGTAGLQQERLSGGRPMRGPGQSCAGSDKSLRVSFDLCGQPVGSWYRPDEGEHGRCLHRPFLPGLLVEHVDRAKLAVPAHRLNRRVRQDLDVGDLFDPSGQVTGHILMEVVAANDEQHLAATPGKEDCGLPGRVAAT